MNWYNLSWKPNYELRIVGIQLFDFKFCVHLSRVRSWFNFPWFVCLSWLLVLGPVIFSRQEVPTIWMILVWSSTLAALYHWGLRKHNIFEIPAMAKDRAGASGIKKTYKTNKLWYSVWGRYWKSSSEFCEKHIRKFWIKLVLLCSSYYRQSWALQIRNKVQFHDHNYGAGRHHSLPSLLLERPP